MSEDNFKRWSPTAQDRAYQALRDEVDRPWRPFYCPNPLCNGRPHGPLRKGDVPWDFDHARQDQRAPMGDWLTWLLLAGRGSGKTRAGSEWTHRLATKPVRIALISPTGPDFRDTQVEGEALALDTPVPTPSGWTTMGDLTEGDVIYGGDGQPCRVVEAYPVLQDRPCYAVQVEGAKIVADAQHKWVTSTHNERTYGYRSDYPKGRYEQVRTTQEIALSAATAGGWGSSEHAIHVSAIDGGAVDLPVDPYTLGYWLGDGSKRSAHITSHPDDQAHVRAFIEEAGYSTQVSWGQDKRGFTFLVKGLSRDLIRAGVKDNKHVPEVYYSASPGQRLALLQGLMDSDGTISQRGQVEFSNKNPDLILAVLRLMSSLGAKARIIMRDSGQGRVRATSSIPMFRLPRKAARVPGWRTEREWRYIQAIEPTPSVPVRCIRVDSPDSTFLVSDHYVRTHNSGILATAPPGKMPFYEPSKKKLTWPSGAVAYGYSAEEPDRLRGKQHHYSWIDEPAHAPLITEVWDNLLFGLRLGSKPRICATTTPLPTDWNRRIVADKTTVITRASTFDNIHNLAGTFADIILSRYDGTRKGRQEIHGELLEDVEGALWSAEWIKYLPEGHDPELIRIVVAIDPAGTARAKSDETGIIVVATDGENFYVLADYSGKYSPSGWARRALNAVDMWGADYIVAEKNYGGDMVKAVLEAEAKGRSDLYSIQTVTSRRGKALRADPIATLYEKDRVKHVEPLPKLENQMTSWVPGNESPDRVDALVHGITDLARVVAPAMVADPTTLSNVVQFPRRSA